MKICFWYHEKQGYYLLLLLSDATISGEIKIIIKGGIQYGAQEHLDEENRNIVVYPELTWDMSITCSNY